MRQPPALVRRVALAAALAAAAGASAAAASPARPAAAPAPFAADSARLVAAADSLARAALAGGRAAGMSIAVSLGGRPVLARGYGFADLEWRVPTPDRAIYEIGSVTKQFTAAAVLQLVEQGKLDLDADVRHYLPDYDAQGRRVPVRRLLDHTSGIQPYTAMDAFRERFERNPMPRDSLVRVFSKAPFTFEPGTAQAYNNSGFFLLGLLIEKVSGVPYADYVRDHLFARAGLRDARYCSNTEIVPRMAHGYDTGKGGLERAAYIDFTWPYAAGSLCASAADLDAWNRALHGGRVLGAAAYRQLVTADTLVSGDRISYAKGLALNPIGGRRAISHGGDIPGFASFLAWFPADSLSIAVTINSEGPVRPDALAGALAAAVHGPASAVRAGRVPAADYVGVYAGRGGQGEPLTLRIAADSAGRLTLSGPIVPGERPAPLTHAARDTFQLGGNRIVFARTGARVTRLVFDAAYAWFALPRAAR